MISNSNFSSRSYVLAHCNWERGSIGRPRFPARILPGLLRIPGMKDYPGNPGGKNARNQEKAGDTWVRTIVLYYRSHIFHHCDLSFLTRAISICFSLNVVAAIATTTLECYQLGTAIVKEDIEQW